MDSNDFVREALAHFFRRRHVAGRVFCASCLAQQLTRHASGAFSEASVQTVLSEVFKHTAPLRVTSRGPCAVCQKPRRCLGTARPSI